MARGSKSYPLSTLPRNTNIGNNKFEPLMSRNDAEQEMHAKDKPKPSSAQKKTGKISASKSSSASIRPHEVVAQTESSQWVTVGGKQSNKAPKTPVKNQPGNEKTPASHSQQTASLFASITEVNEHKVAEFPPLPVSVADTKKVSSKASMAKASKPRQDKRSPPAVPTKVQNRNVIVTSIEAISRSTPGAELVHVKPTAKGKAGKRKAGKSKNPPKADLDAQAASLPEALNATAVASTVSIEVSTLSNGDVGKHVPAQQSNAIISDLREPSTPPQNDAYQCQKIHEARNDLMAEGYEHTALESHMALHSGTVDSFCEVEEYCNSSSAIEPTTRGETYRGVEIVETSVSFDTLVAPWG